MFGSLRDRLKKVVEKFSKEERPKDSTEDKSKLERIEEEIVKEFGHQETQEIKEQEKEEHELVDETKQLETVTLEEAVIEKEKTVQELKPELPEEKFVEEKKGIFGRIVKKVQVKVLSEDEINKILKDLKVALLENDVAFEVAEKIASDVKNDLVGKEVRREKTEVILKDSLRNAILDVMQKDKLGLERIIKTKKPFTIIFLGFNGTGKTTTIAKVAYKFKNAFRIVLAAGDTFRAASIEQLEEHGKKLGISVIKQKYGSDSAAVIFDAKKHAEANNIDLVLADTAGRSHSNVNLMDELKKVVRVNKPDYKILVLDALTGNDIYSQSKLFNDAVGVDAIILTKADVYEKGGSALSAAYTIKKPILYLGTGQSYNELKEFDPEEIVKNLLGE